MGELILTIKGDEIQGIYDELLDLRGLGQVSIRRASMVEPDEEGRWWADMGLSGGPVLGPFSLRSQALAAEVEWLEKRI